MASNDVVMADATSKEQGSSDPSDLLRTNYCDAFAFSRLETKALALYDELRELELQQSFLEAQKTARVPDVSALSDDVLQKQLTNAQREVMEAKAEYEIRNRIVENVLIMDPVLKAVHGGEHTGFAEKRMLPLIAENDSVSMLEGSLTGKLAIIQNKLSESQQANIIANKKNYELSQTMLALAEDLKSQSTWDIRDAKLQDQVSAVERELKNSKRRAKTLKGMLSAMIVGSGVNWAADESLTELVLDDEDD